MRIETKQRIRQGSRSLLGVDLKGKWWVGLKGKKLTYS